MNYELQVLAFEKQSIANPYRLSKNAQILWYRLNTLLYLTKGNWFISLPADKLSQYVGVSRSTLYFSTVELVEKGFIDYIVGARANPPEYHIKNLIETINEKGEKLWIVT